MNWDEGDQILILFAGFEPNILARLLNGWLRQRPPEDLTRPDGRAQTNNATKIGPGFNFMLEN